MLKGVFDVESNGFLRELTHLHCIVIQNYDSLDIFAYHDHSDEFQPCHGTLTEGIKQLEELKVTIAHNQCNFDVLAIEEVYPDYSPEDKQISIDSLALSRLLYPEMKMHSIEAWAKKLKLEVQKVQNDDWSHLTQNMLDRCIADVKINTEVIKYLWSVVSDHEASSNNSARWWDALMLEQEIMRIHGKQTLHGVVYDVKEAHKNLEYLDSKLLSLKDKITRGAPPVMKVPGVTGPTLAELRKIAAWSFTEERHLHKGVATPFRKVKRVEVKKPFKKNGDLTAQALKVLGIDYKGLVKGAFSKYEELGTEDKYIGHTIKWFGEDLVSTVQGAYSKVEFNPLNLNADVQVKNFLYSLGWIPDEWNNKRLPDGSFKRTSPKLSESSFGSLPEGLGQDIKLYNTLKHRRSSIQSITSPETKGALSKVRDDGRVPAEGITCGTPTARYRHSGA